MLPPDARHPIVAGMCGRYASPDKEAIVMRWPRIRCGGGCEWKPSANVAPTTDVPIVVQARDGQWELQAARWGLVPAWWTRPAPPARTFNARAEDAAHKPIWRDALRTARCLLPARGWYEWRRNQLALDAAGREGPQPYFLFCPTEPVIAFAGVWSLWTRPDAAPRPTCALFTCPAAPGIAAIHPRMPAALTPAQGARWLDPAAAPDEIAALLAAARTDLDAHPVSTRVNDVRHDAPDLTVRVSPPPAGLFPPDSA